MGPFAPTLMPGVPMPAATTTMPFMTTMGFNRFGAPAPGPAPMAFGAFGTPSPFGTTPSPFGTTPSAFGAFGTTPSPFGALAPTISPYGTTMRPFLLLDVNSGDDGALPPLSNFVMPPLPPLPPLPPAAEMAPMPGMMSLSFLQGGMQDMGGAFRTSRAIPGCNCGCAKREAALMEAQQNAFKLMEFPEDGETVPWGHSA